MRQRKNTDKTSLPEEEVLPLNECVANLKDLGLDDKEIAQLDETLDVIIDHQLDKVFDKYN